MSRSLTPTGLIALALIAAPASADITNFREWISANGVGSNSTSNTWYGLAGIDGPLLSPLSNSNGSYWAYTPTFDDTPLLALPTTVGSYGGAAGACTFDGSWVHTGSGVPAVLVFAPSVTTFAGGMSVRSELIANGLSGNGVTITVYTVIGGVTTNRGTTTLGGTSTDQTDLFAFGSGVTLGVGDKVMIAFGDRGSYLHDHVNFNAWLTVPAPGAIVLLAAAGLVGSNRRR